MINVGYIVMGYQKRISSKSEVTDEDKLNVLKSFLKPKNYIPYKEKQEMIKNLINETTTNICGKIYYDSCERNYKFVCLMLEKYYDLEITDSTYDKLSSIGILGYLMAIIASEFEMCKSIFDSYVSDVNNGRILLTGESSNG